MLFLKMDIVPEKHVAHLYNQQGTSRMLLEYIVGMCSGVVYYCNLTKCDANCSAFLWGVMLCYVLNMRLEESVHLELLQRRDSELTKISFRKPPT